LLPETLYISPAASSESDPQPSNHLVIRASSLLCAGVTCLAEGLKQMTYSFFFPSLPSRKRRNSFLADRPRSSVTCVGWQGLNHERCVSVTRVGGGGEVLTESSTDTQAEYLSSAEALNASSVTEKSVVFKYFGLKTSMSCLTESTVVCGGCFDSVINNSSPTALSIIGDHEFGVCVYPAMVPSSKPAMTTPATSPSVIIVAAEGLSTSVIWSGL
jgi:hypothetical protein